MENHGKRWIRVPEMAYDFESGAYRAYVFITPEALPAHWNRDKVLESFAAQNVPVYSGSCSEVYLEKAFDNTSWRPEKPLPVAKALGEQSLMFLVHPTLTDTEITRTCAAIGHVNQLIQSQQGSLGSS